MLMVDGVLYMWARNAGNARLAWSTDHARTWEWSDWTFTTSFGCPTFLNFGRDYAGARDDYVYVYSHDNDNAYEPADRMVLARVPKSRIKDRGAYEFFEGRDATNAPVWTADIARRGAVFRHEAACYRSGISYDAGLKRYLWCQILPGDDPRFRGGFGIYDAPEPWGPVDHRILHRSVGRRPRGDQQLSHQVDERRRQDPLPRLLRRRQLLGAQGELNMRGRGSLSLHSFMKIEVYCDERHSIATSDNPNPAVEHRSGR